MKCRTKRQTGLLERSKLGGFGCEGGTKTGFNGGLGGSLFGATGIGRGTIASADDTSRAVNSVAVVTSLAKFNLSASN